MLTVFLFVLIIYLGDIMYDVAIEILNKISDLGYEAYIIGGFSRDLYLGINNSDIDMCTNAKYDDLKDTFEITKGNFGSMRLKYKDYDFEITTFRKEFEYEKNRFPKNIEFVNTLAEDLERRDFTINTLCIDKNGSFIDLLDAKNDIDNKIIRCVGDSDFKISQDVLRSLRAIRFATILNFQIDNNLKESIKKYNYLLTNLSDKRKKEEVNKILNSKNKEYGLSLIVELELDKFLTI